MRFGEVGECGALDANAPPFGRSCIPIGVPESCARCRSVPAFGCISLPNCPVCGSRARAHSPDSCMSTSTRDWSAVYVYLCTYYVQVRKKKGGKEANSPIWEADRGFQSARVSSLTHPLALIRRSLDWIGLDDENKKGNRKKKIEIRKKGRTHVPRPAQRVGGQSHVTQKTKQPGECETRTSPRHIFFQKPEKY